MASSFPQRDQQLYSDGRSNVQREREPRQSGQPPAGACLVRGPCGDRPAGAAAHAARLPRTLWIAASSSARSIGLLLVAWGAWLISSLRIAPFTWWLLLLVLALLGAASAWLAGPALAAVARFLQARWRLLALRRGALLAALSHCCLYVRMHNPDLWHPGTGGEKPMDLAYLNAIVRTPYFPSYDPWFAGGYINYYYFGFVLVAALIHLTGMVPYIAYNLAVPTFFALTALRPSVSR